MALRYFYSEMGIRLKPANEYTRYEAFMQYFFGVNWGINHTRHFLIGMSREFIEANETFMAIQRVMAASSDHSVDVEKSHYAIQYKDVPRLTSSYVWEARYVIREWWKAIGALGTETEYSVPLRSRVKVDVEDISTQIVRCVEEKLAGSLEVFMRDKLASIITEALPFGLPGKLCQLIH